MRKLIFTFLLLVFSVFTESVFSQTSYSSVPQQGTFTSLTNINTTCTNFTSYGQNALKMRVVISGNQATFRVEPNSGSFSSSGTCYIKANDACGTVLGSATYSSGNTYVLVSITLTHTTGTNYYVGMTLSNANWRNHTKSIYITATTTQSVNLSLNSSMSFGTANLLVGSSYPFTTKIKNNGSSSWNGSLYLKQGSNDWINKYNVTINAGSTYSFSGTYTPTSAGNNLPVTMYYQTGGTGTGTQLPSGSYSNPFYVNVCNVVSQPTLSSPANSHEYGTAQTTIVYSWTKNNNAGVGTYRLRIRDITTDPTNGPVIFDQNVGDVSSYSHSYSYTAGSTYRWVVYTVGGCSQEIVSTAWTFSIAEPVNLSLNSSMSFGTANLLVGSSYPFTTTIKNNSNSTWNGSLYLKQGSNDWINKYNVTINAGSTYSFSGTYTPTSAGNNLPVTMYYQTGGTGTGTQLPSGSYSNPFYVNVCNVVSQPTLSSPANSHEYGTAQTTIVYSWTKNNNAGFGTYRLRIKDITTDPSNGPVIFDQNVGDVSSYSHSYSYTAGSIYRWVVYTVGGCSQEIVSTAWTFSIAEPVNLSLNSSMSFGTTNLLVGSSYSFTTTIKNNGNSTWNGSLYLKQGSNDWINKYSVTINAGSTYSFSGTYTPTSAGNNLLVDLWYQTGGIGAGVLLTQGSFLNPITININNTSSVCSFTDCSSPTNCGSTNYQNEAYDAIQYLCSHNIISSSNNNVNPDNNITRAQLAKIAFYGVFSDSAMVPAPLVSDFFPSPYADLQDTNTYYYKAAKALMYLEFGDGITPFDRDRLYFEPSGTISRRLVLKVLLETFNIPPTTGGTNPFSDFPSGSDCWGYAKAAHTLGITQTTQFRPYDNCTRAEAFIFLYRIMTHTSNLFPLINNNLNPNTSSFYIPLNISLLNMSGLGIESGNFNLYEKSCFQIQGRLPLDFGFNYNSYISELPKEVYPLNPLSMGWSHTYNMYINIVEETSMGDAKLFVHMPDGSLNVYKKTGNSYIPETEGNYNTLTCVSSSKFEFKTKSHIVYCFEKLDANDVAFVLTSIKDRNNNTINISYHQGIDYTLPGTTTNTTKNISTVTDPSGRTLVFTYHQGTNLLQSVTDPLNRSIYFSYTNGLLSGFTNAMGLTTSYNYGTSVNDLNLLLSIQLPKGNIINNQYFQRKLTSTRFNNNSPTTITHNPNYVSGINNFYKSVVTVPQQSGQSITTNYEMDKLGNITKADGNNAVNMTSSYNNPLHPTMPSSITNNQNNVTVTPAYSSNGNVTQITTSGGGITTTETFQYNSFNDVTQHTNANGQTTYCTHDSNGNLTQLKDALNNVTNITNNSHGQPTSITNPSGVTVIFGYNNYGNQNQVSIPSLGLTASMNYDAASRMISATNFSGQNSTYTYDANDNLLTEMDAMNNITTYTHDQNDNLISITNAKGQTTTFSYDNVTDWLLSESFQNATKTYTYNADGSFNTFTNPNGVILNYVYDNSGRIINDGYASYAYNSNGNLLSITKDGKSIMFEYDGLNRVISVTYDGFSVAYTYDNMSNVTSITYPGNKTVTYIYDAVGNLISVKDWNNNTTTYNYRPDGQLADMTYPNGVKTTYTYDNAGRPTGISTKRNNGSGSVITEYTFTLDPVGNHIQESIIEQYTTYPSMPSATVNYSYNNANIIQSAGDISFGFDNNGNTTSKTAYSYGYDVLNILTSVSGNFNANYVHDGAGNRREATRNGVVTKYVLDILGMSNVLMETDAGGTPQNYYVYGLGLISRIKPNNTTHYYVYDYRGSTVAMTDATTSANVTHKYQFDDFGNILQLQEADFNPFRYVGKYGVMYEDSSLYYMRARYYDPTIGRFLSEDPIWSTNLYPYANNNPLNLIDFDGMQAVNLNTILHQNFKKGGSFVANSSQLKKITESISKELLKVLNSRGGFNNGDIRLLYNFPKKTMPHINVNQLKALLFNATKTAGVIHKVSLSLKTVLKINPIQYLLNYYINTIFIGNGMYNINHDGYIIGFSA